MAATSSNGASGAHEYEVFLSFRGTDTRLTFTDFLYESLVDEGVVAFRDSEDLHVGDKIPELLRAVSNSEICVLVLSKGYATSTWCLREIEQAVNHHESTGTPKILPVFLDVTPADVKLKTALYADALDEHEKEHGHDLVRRWKAALKTVAEIKGWEGQGQGQGKLVKSIVEKILYMVNRKEIFVLDLIGIDEQVSNVMGLLDIDSHDVRFIGVHGAGGIGKTTLAKIIFNKLCYQFEKCSFISDVRESVNKNGLENLLKKLSCDLHNSSHVDISVRSVDEGRRFIQRRARSKKVLIVLDDIDDSALLENLIGALSSLGLGSRVLITTRDKGILTVVDGVKTYEVNHLKLDEALKLFSTRAFKNESPPDTYCNLSKKIVSKAGGLPLILSILGSHLHDKSEEIWIETLDILNKMPLEKVLDKLMISYNALSENEKCIFLDIACFFVNMSKRWAMDMWEACNLNPRNAIEVLTNKSLIKIHDDDDDDGYIWMHDLLREFGRTIVFRENPKDVAGRSRLWKCEEALNVVRLKKRKDEVETLVLAKWHNEPFVTEEELKNLPNLRFLKLRGGTFVGDFKNHISKLKCIHWDSPPPNYRLTNFCLKELVHFELSNCEVTEDWGGWNLLKVTNKIKVLVLERCTGLTSTPDLSGCYCLERLSLRKCSNIQAIDSSIGKLKRLISICINQCRNFQSLPTEIGVLAKLNYFSIVSPEHYALELKTKIQCLPISIGNAKCLSTLNLRNSLICELPSSISELKQLNSLFLGGCERLGKLPKCMGKLAFLEHLDISSTKIVELPDSIGHLKQLKVLTMDYCSIKKLPVTIGGLESLEELHARSCGLEGELPSEIGKLSFLKILCLSGTQICAMPSTINLLTHLEELDLDCCFNLQELPELPVSLKCLCVRSSSLQLVSNLSNLTNLVKLLFWSESQEALTPTSSIVQTSFEQWIGRPSKLEDLKLHLPIISTPWCLVSFKSRIVSSWFSNLMCLTKLELSCFPIEEIQLSGLKVLRHLNIQDCGLLKRLSISSSLRMLEELLVSNCPLLMEIQILGELKILDIRYCDSLIRLCDLSKLRKLKFLFIRGCNGLQEIEIIGNLEALRYFHIERCNLLGRIHGLLNCKNLNSVSIDSCRGLRVVDGIDELDLDLLSVKECNELPS